MIEALFITLTRAMDATPALAVAASFMWGILSILLSPCHLSSIPLIVGFVDRQGSISTRRAFSVSTLFSVGILDHHRFDRRDNRRCGPDDGRCGEVRQLHRRGDFLPRGAAPPGRYPHALVRPFRRTDEGQGPLAAAFILGLVFGIALGPCTFAYMAPVLTITFSLAGTSILYGVLLLLAYGLGHCSVIVFAGTFTEVIQRYLNWNERSAGTVIVKRVCGALVILGGVYLIYSGPIARQEREWQN